MSQSHQGNTHLDCNYDKQEDWRKIYASRRSTSKLLSCPKSWAKSTRGQEVSPMCLCLHANQGRDILWQSWTNLSHTKHMALGTFGVNNIQQNHRKMFKFSHRLLNSTRHVVNYHCRTIWKKNVDAELYESLLRKVDDQRCFQVSFCFALSIFLLQLFCLSYRKSKLMILKRKI